MVQCFKGIRVLNRMVYLHDVKLLWGLLRLDMFAIFFVAIINWSRRYHKNGLSGLLNQRYFHQDFFLGFFPPSLLWIPPATWQQLLEFASSYGIFKVWVLPPIHVLLFCASRCLVLVIVALRMIFLFSEGRINEGCILVTITIGIPTVFCHGIFLLLIR